MVAISFNSALDPREQHKTLLQPSDLASSWATLFATVVFPNPGPPVMTAMETVPLWTASMTC